MVCLFACLLNWLQVTHFYVVINSLCTDIYSSLISKVDLTPVRCVSYGMGWVTHCWYHNICTYFFAVCFKEILVSTPWRWQDKNAKTCRSYV